jgi:hypothetical protein
MAVAMMATITLAQAEKQDSAHTLVTPNAPDPGRAGTVVQLRLCPSMCAKVVA